MKSIFKKSEPITSKAILVVTGQCSDTELAKFEEHCRLKGQTVIATRLPVLGVFNMNDASPIDGTTQ